MKEMQVELINEKCMDCPRLELETVERMCQKSHRCKNLQFCREVLGFWKENSRINELEITERRKAGDQE